MSNGINWTCRNGDVDLFKELIFSPFRINDARNTLQGRADRPIGPVEPKVQLQCLVCGTQDVIEVSRSYRPPPGTPEGVL